MDASGQYLGLVSILNALGITDKNINSLMLPQLRQLLLQHAAFKKNITNLERLSKSFFPG